MKLFWDAFTLNNIRIDNKSDYFWGEPTDTSATTATLDVKRRRRGARPVKIFSKLNYFISGYFDPTNIFFDIKNI